MAAQGDRRLETKFLNRKRIRSLPVDSEERIRKIVRRCNWYMFSNCEIRGDSPRAILEFFKLCQTAIPDYPPEQERPNEELAHNPPSESFFAKYFMPYPEGSSYWFMRQDLIPENAIHNVLAIAWQRWQTVSTRAKQVYEAIDSIQKPKRIKKVVCLGLGPILTALHNNPGENISDCLSPRNVAQHCLVIAIVKQLEEKTGQQINLYTADPGYTPQHKIALEQSTIIPFIVLDPSYGKHEQFTVIDGDTMLVNFAGPPECPTMSLIQEYARPVVIITTEVPRKRPFQDRQWFEVTEEDGNKVKIPGCANLPLPSGAPVSLDTLCPKRVRDMIVREYKIEKKFPAEDPNLVWTWGNNELVDYGSRDHFSANGGYYWHSNLRMYVRRRCKN
ncbi:hypothetical protein F4781DRAFT_424052 [Annulohypoxylon bovei var. microspora]|nr:hypothetical protein F4781DRAFT_424052 [Annulohypoxylon bovei var. microspora]